MCSASRVQFRELLTSRHSRISRARGFRRGALTKLTLIKIKRRQPVRRSRSGRVAFSIVFFPPRYLEAPESAAPRALGEPRVLAARPIYNHNYSRRRGGQKEGKKCKTVTRGSAPPFGDRRQPSPLSISPGTLATPRGQFYFFSFYYYFFFVLLFSRFRPRFSITGSEILLAGR